MRQHMIDTDRHARLLAVCLLWMFVGGLLLASTLVPAYTELLGWTPLFWLIGAPLAVALTLEPRLPRLVVSLFKPRRRTASPLIWH